MTRRDEMKIIQTGFESSDAGDLLVLLNSEWNDLSAFETSREGLAIPEPLVAIEAGRVIGGAAFTAYREPGGTDVVVWLNALYVLPQFRGQGIASGLIVAAMAFSPRLYALTDIPDLYTKLGWNVCSNSESGSVVGTPGRVPGRVE